MEVAKSTIKKILIKAGYPDCNYNVLTIKDALQFEDREDYKTIEDAVMDAIEDAPSLAVVSG